MGSFPIDPCDAHARALGSPRREYRRLLAVPQALDDGRLAPFVTRERLDPSRLCAKLGLGGLWFGLGFGLDALGSGSAAVVSSRPMASPSLLRRNDEIGCDPDLALPA
jgi:hypothetical protein